MRPITATVARLFLCLRVAESEIEKKLKSVNIWQSCQQKRDCLVHFLRLSAVSWPGALSA